MESYFTFSHICKIRSINQYFIKYSINMKNIGNLHFHFNSEIHIKYLNFNNNSYQLIYKG